VLYWRVTLFKYRLREYPSDPLKLHESAREGGLMILINIVSVTEEDNARWTHALLQSKDVIGATAAYAAMLVVFVGTSIPARR
jgi:hypothetical protein